MEQENGEDGRNQRDGPGVASGRARAAVRLVLADAGRVGHHVGDVVLLVDPVEEVSHGALGEDGHVLPSVRFHPQRDG